MINYYYYIEVKHENSIISPISTVVIKPEDMTNFDLFPEGEKEKAYAKYIYDIWNKYCNNKQWYHYTLRIKYNEDCIHYLIAEKYSKYLDTWYYTNYGEYKRFSNLLGFSPDEKEKTA